MKTGNHEKNNDSVGSVEEWDLTAVNMHRITQHNYEVAVLPVGAIEPHNRHLPQGQDFRHTSWVARESCRRAWQDSPGIICLPTIPYGVDCNLLDFPLTIHVAQATVDAMLRDIIVSLHHHGIRKTVIINGHGGNDFGPFIRQIQCDLDTHVFLCDWWKVGWDQYDRIFDYPDDHAGEFETSVALNLYPELVDLEEAGSGQARPFRFEALEQGWVTTSRRFIRLNDHCAAGNPAAGSAEKGRRYLELVCQRISKFLTELAQTPIDRDFPHMASESP